MMNHGIKQVSNKQNIRHSHFISLLYQRPVPYLPVRFGPFLSGAHAVAVTHDICCTPYMLTVVDVLPVGRRFVLHTSYRHEQEHFTSVTVRIIIQKRISVCSMQSSSYNHLATRSLCQ